MRKSYIDGPFGQIHLSHWEGGVQSKAPTICLPPSPYSGIAYNTFAPFYMQDRAVIAMDYPGYGGSVPVEGEPSIRDFALAAVTVAKTLYPDTSVNFLGFHTGCLVAIEASLLCPERVHQLALVDIPFFESAQRAGLREKMGATVKYKPTLEMLAASWEFSVSKRLEQVPLARAYEMFVDQVSAGENVNYAFRAAFSYPCEEQFLKVACKAFVFATKAGLYEPTLKAAQIIPEAILTEVPEISVSVLEQGAPIIAELINEVM